MVTFGVSVAVFSSFQNGDIESSIQVGDLTFHYTEMSGLGNGINIEDGEQLSDSEGKVLDTYFDFRIESNLVNSDLEYEVSVEPTNNSNMPLAGVKFYLTELKNSSEIELNSNFNG